VDEARIKKRIERGFCDIMVKDIDEAIAIAKNSVEEKNPTSIGLLGNTAETHPLFLEKGIIPDVITDQTSAHDPLYGYIPRNLSLKEAEELRKNEPKEYIKRAYESMGIQVNAMLKFMNKGSVVFDYGNNLRDGGYKAGVKDAFSYPGFVSAYIRPMFCEGRGPFRWIALSGDKEDIYKTDKVVIDEFKDNKQLVNWIELAEKNVPFEGLPARVCWLGYGERARFAKIINEMVSKEELNAPIAITRDHLDCGSVASPYRETENMNDGSDAIADWPLLNALLNCCAGADSVQIHSGGGVGIGYSVHAGMVVIADGSNDTEKRIERVFTTDPGIGIVRHADAGYQTAIDFAKRKGIKMPMME
ncbi:MAG: urocanate hydratase, partial [Candidatus Thermoplasmatota archaeon]